MRTFIPALLISLLLNAAGVAWGVERNGFDLSDALVPVAEIQGGGPEKDGIPALDHPAFIVADQADFLASDDRVLGLAHHGIAKAYPIVILNWHEVINDRFGSEPVVVTFCPLCGTGMAFLATVEGRVLDFGVSGLLYNSDVLLYDRQTESLWSQLMTTAITGPLKGQRLTMAPVAHTTWADWRQRHHPQTLVLSPDTGHQRDYGRDPYAGYVQSEQVMFPLRFKNRRFHPKEPVIGVELDGRFKAYPFTELERTAISFADQIGDHPVRIEYDAAHRTGRVFDATGQQIPSVIGFWFAWYAFHPETEVYTASPAR
jgi:hypothetical protein